MNQERRGWADWMNEKACEGLGFRKAGPSQTWVLPDGKSLIHCMQELTHTRPSGEKFVVADDLLTHECFCLKQATFSPVCWMTLGFGGFTGLITQMVLGCNFENDRRMSEARTQLIIHAGMGPVWPADFQARLGLLDGTGGRVRIRHQRIEPEGMNLVTYTTTEERVLTWTQYLALGEGPRRLIGKMIVDFKKPSKEFLGQLTRKFGFPQEILV